MTMWKLFWSLVPALLGLSNVQAQDISGDWLGALKAGGVELRLALHITKAGQDGWRASLDSVDQGAMGLPVTSISLKDSKLEFTVDSVHGSYQGKINPDATAIHGTWSQGQPLPLDFVRGSVKGHKAAKPSDIDGAWMGSLDTGTAKIRMVFHLVNTEDGLTATADSPDQGAMGMPVTAVTRNGAALKLEMKQIGGTFEGEIAKDLSAISGTWTQGGGSLPLVLKPLKDKAQLERRRPQNPVKPYPYREEDVSIHNAVQNVQLAATLTVPDGAGPFAAVVLITGSGPQDRDESLMGHRPFLVLADYLTRRGIVVLRADDRGTGKSTGNFGTATSADFATDTEAGVTYLLSRREVNPHKIGLIGHSEGGLIAPMVAARNHNVAFIVMMAGPGVPGDQVLVAQTRLITEANGKSHEEAEKIAAQEREILNLVKEEKNRESLEKKVKEKLAGLVPEAQLGAQIKVLDSAWMRYFLDYDPAVALRKLSCPVLALNGGKDLQVPPGQNLPAIRSALEASGNKDFEVDELPGLNHLFQTARTGNISEYAEIEETMSPVALDKIASWVAKQ